jgi:hypothetical protein
MRPFLFCHPERQRTGLTLAEPLFIGYAYVRCVTTFSMTNTVFNFFRTSTNPSLSCKPSCFYG